MRHQGRELQHRYGHLFHGGGFRLMEGFQKVWFSLGSEKTAGLILSAAKLRGMNTYDVARRFPKSRAVEMGHLHQSPVFATRDEASRYNI